MKSPYIVLTVPPCKETIAPPLLAELPIKSPVIAPIKPRSIRIAPPPSTPGALLPIKSPITVPNLPFISIAPPPLLAELPIKSPKIISIVDFFTSVSPLSNLLEITPPQPSPPVPALLPMNLP